ncbi:helix-turn-helix domain-containing protein [Saccharothrix sp. HUAS TT1]|uniref:helix-turn-helix domain-containing protein n=1 Tax=unclassified Saccharothrix TaxID=2593673 RepID=UPI00345BA226
MRDDSVFGRRLRELRQRKRLSQKMLGDRAALSVRAIRDLEVGRVQRPREQTVRLLADGLQLTGSQRAAFERAARGTGQDPPGHGGAPDAGGNGPPVFSGPFIGREAELAILTELLTTDTQQVISIAGVAGAGKTRLASEVSKAVLGRPDWRVLWYSGNEVVAPRSDIREPHDPSGFPPLDGGTSPGVDLSKVLVVFDGASRASAQVLAELLRHTPRPHLLITARNPPGLPGELVFPVGPLPVPTSYEGIQDLVGNPSVRLLLWHVRRVYPSFQLRGDNAAAVARLCRLLDGLPGALELGAAMCTVRSPQRLVDQLIDRPAAIRDWRSSAGSGELLLSSLGESLNPLRRAERILLNSLASSDGDWSVDEAAAVAELAGADAVEHMELLVRRGLVRHDRQADEPRFSLLKLVRTAHDATPRDHASTSTPVC